jgi:hypothetical protein
LIIMLFIKYFAIKTTNIISSDLKNNLLK